MIGDGLSLDQAPPLHAPLRFFFTAPLFLILASSFLLANQFDLFNRWMPHTIGSIHFFTLGFLVMTMIGALTQMLPVLAGVRVPKVVMTSTLIHLLLCVGALLFPFGMIFFDQRAIWIGATSAFVAILVFYTITLFTLRKAIPSYTITSFKISAISALIMLIFAARLAYGWAIGNFSINRIALTELHIAWALFGMTFTLLMGVSYKVVPMFFVTADHPKWLTHYGAKLIFTLLFIWTTIFHLSLKDSWSELIQIIPMIKFLIATIVTIYSIETIKRFKTRKRPTTDTTIVYWNLSMSLFILAAMFYGISQIIKIDFDAVIGLTLGGALISLITGMLYKIIPFLVWFHLTAAKKKKVPTMRELLPDRYSRTQFFTFGLSLMILLISIYFTPFLKLGLATFLLSQILLLICLLIPVRTYLKLIA